MMVCGRCHFIGTGKTLTDKGHMFRSLGPCETCKVTRECGECQCEGNWAQAVVT